MYMKVNTSYKNWLLWFHIVMNKFYYFLRNITISPSQNNWLNEEKNSWLLYPHTRYNLTSIKSATRLCIQSIITMFRMTLCCRSHGRSNFPVCFYIRVCFLLPKWNNLYFYCGSSQAVSIFVAVEIRVTQLQQFFFNDLTR